MKTSINQLKKENEDLRKQLADATHTCRILRAKLTKVIELRSRDREEADRSIRRRSLLIEMLSNEITHRPVSTQPVQFTTDSQEDISLMTFKRLVGTTPDAENRKSLS